jgi:hypothetical protein
MPDGNILRALYDGAHQSEVLVIWTKMAVVRPRAIF